MAKKKYLGYLLLILMTSVAIIGGGLAGLTAAYRLQQKGIDVDLYEAKDRVGGRILSAFIDGRAVELGAQNFRDGGDSKHLFQLLGELGIPSCEEYYTLNFHYYKEGKLYPVSDLMKDYSFTPENLRSRLEEIAKKSKNMHEVLLQLFGKQSPLYHVYSVRLAGFEGTTPEKLSPLYIETLYYMLLGGLCSVYTGSGDMKLSYIEEGNSRLPMIMAEILKGRVHLSMPVVKVVKHPQSGYELFFRDGQKKNADLLILAMPASVYSSIDFQNCIPKERLEAIQKIQYGDNSKILFYLPERQKRQLTNNRMVAFCNGKNNIITFFYSGSASCFSKENIASLYRQDCTDYVQAGLGDPSLLALTPMLAEDRPFLFYDCPIGYSWPNDPYIKGSYSCIAPGQEYLVQLDTIDGEKTRPLFAPLYDTLFFAGEHTSILLETPGTLEAAVESGERAARLILKHL